MKKPQAMMFYPEDWKGSTGVAVMEPAARAGYFDILCSIWLSGGSLPDDDRTLHACSRLEAVRLGGALAGLLLALLRVKKMERAAAAAGRLEP